MFVYRRQRESQMLTQRGRSLHGRVVVVMADHEERKGKEREDTLCDEMGLARPEGNYDI